ncbi:hypothetical protein K503DRAFT_800464 [Rhizopogon vinicolor AM-OR11-026]|uniref:G domain-containing protein n=1 Tax=Rhizopogon vinicolor AM-OR11-026 TaxID=1314800 RepID=A0A1B7N0N9_9AGAM|nr:hypothetical protein K503DRAFT_800464 [Rhizopogon vinicolor AM-OR11-026]
MLYDHQLISSSEIQDSARLVNTRARFRILVIGKTGVGKSSLICHAFGVQNAPVSDEKRGNANIDTEYISEQNHKFVLHDSEGFEPGDEVNVKIVRDFIQRRRHMKALEDKLHTIWLCFEIPRAGGRLMEKAMQDFLQLKCDGELGEIPVVVVFTKCDKFMDRVERTLNDNDLDGLSDYAVKDIVKQRTDAELHDICTQPLMKLAGSDIPYAMISTKETHKETISHLIQITEKHVCQQVASEASVMTSIA